MADLTLHSKEQRLYVDLLQQIKERVRLAQQRAIFSASGEMLRMYWDVGVKNLHLRNHPFRKCNRIVGSIVANKI